MIKRRRILSRSLKEAEIDHSLQVQPTIYTANSITHTLGHLPILVAAVAVAMAPGLKAKDIATMMVVALDIVVVLPATDIVLSIIHLLPLSLFTLASPIPKQQEILTSSK